MWHGEMEEVPEGEELEEGSDPEVGNTAKGHRIFARNKTSRSSTRGVAAGETRSALREVTARREHPATSREALCEGGKPLNEKTRTRFIPNQSLGGGTGAEVAGRGSKPQDRECGPVRASLRDTARRSSVAESVTRESSQPTFVQKTG